MLLSRSHTPQHAASASSRLQARIAPGLLIPHYSAMYGGSLPAGAAILGSCALSVLRLEYVFAGGIPCTSCAHCQHLW